MGIFYHGVRGVHGQGRYREELFGAPAGEKPSANYSDLVELWSDGKESAANGSNWLRLIAAVKWKKVEERGERWKGAGDW